MLMIRPPRPCSTMRRAARWAHRNAPSRSTDNVWRQSSQPSSRNGVEREVPALLTSTSTPPSASASSSTTAAAPGRGGRASGRTPQRRGGAGRGREAEPPPLAAGRERAHLLGGRVRAGLVLVPGDADVEAVPCEGD